MAENQKGWFGRLKAGLGRTSQALSRGIDSLFGGRKIDAAAIQELEDLLITADLGVAVAHELAQEIGRERFDGEGDATEVRTALARQIETILAPVARPITLDPAHRPHVVLVAGVNGSGKTTTIAKLAHYYRGEGKRVMLAAGDTFRAAAIEQLKIWGERVGAPVIAAQPGADAAGLAYEALERARAEGADILFIDTAGRLQNRKELMAELQKIVRVLKKLDPSAPHSVVLVLDVLRASTSIAGGSPTT